MEASYYVGSFLTREPKHTYDPNLSKAKHKNTDKPNSYKGNSQLATTK